MWVRFQEGGFFNLLTLGLAVVGLLLALVTVGLGLARRGVVLAVITVLWSAAVVATGAVGTILMRRQVITLVDSAMVPSQRAALLSTGYREAQSSVLFGVLFAVLPAFVSLVALALAMRPSRERPAPPRAIPLIASVLLLTTLGGGFAFWFRGPPKVEQNDEASWLVLDADHILAKPDPNRPYVADACKLMQSFARVPADAPARKHPKFAPVASRCVDFYIERAQSTGRGVALAKDGGSPEDILAELEKSTLPISDAQQKTIATLKKDLQAAKRGKPKVTVEAVTVMGLMDVEAIKKQLAAELGALADCYAAESGTDPFLAGLVVVVATLEKGAPKSVEPRNEPNTLTGVPAACAKKTVEKVRLDSANGLVTVVFRFDLP